MWLHEFKRAIAVTVMILPLPTKKPNSKRNFLPLRYQTTSLTKMNWARRRKLNKRSQPPKRLSTSRANMLKMNHQVKAMTTSDNQLIFINL